MFLLFFLVLLQLSLGHSLLTAVLMRWHLNALDVLCVCVCDSFALSSTFLSAVVCCLHARYLEGFLVGLSALVRGVSVENPAPASDRPCPTQSLAHTAAQWPAVYSQLDPRCCSAG